jgi:hypothetical protein
MSLDLARRDHLVCQFRRYVFDQLKMCPFRHQADWMLASAGLRLTGRPAHPHATQHYIDVRQRDKSVVRMGVTERPSGMAKVIADLGAYKCGKSYGGALWLAGFAAVPGARVDLIGLEYDICTPEFEYLAEILLSDRGLALPYVRFHNQAKSGRMLIELQTGARFECRSWERKDMLKGKERDCYYFAEAYMLPGLSAFTSIAQNLRARQGWAVFTTTADRPWVTIFHEQGHGARPEWHCTCGVHARENPYTWSQYDYERDDPDKGGLMTREQFEVSWKGKLGVFVGRVYNYQRGDRVFTPTSHPEWWKEEEQVSA